MKKTIWAPIIFGVVMGILGGISFAANLAFFSGGDFGAGIGIYGIFWLIAAALGGPLAGAITGSLSLIIGASIGQMKAAMSEPVTFYPNLVISCIVMQCLLGYAYRFIFERFRMPARLLAWAGIIIGWYLIGSPLLTITQYWLRDFSPAVKASYEAFSNNLWAFQLAMYKAFAPQATAYFIITSMVFIALPEHYRRPLWIEPKK